MKIGSLGILHEHEHGGIPCRNGMSWRLEKGQRKGTGLVEFVDGIYQISKFGQIIVFTANIAKRYHKANDWR